MNDAQFKYILDRFEYSWSGYRKVRKGVKKRLVRHMHQLGCRDVRQYLDRLSADPGLRNDCERLLTVSISRFFRDKKLWEGLQQQILPKLAADFNGKVHVLSAGCARGEEVYSLKIIWSLMSKPAELILTALDLNPDYIAAAKSGVYNRGSLKEMPSELITKYFLPVKGRHRYQVVPELKTDISWQTGNLADGLPGSGYHLVLLRNNILTYLNDDTKRRVFAVVLEGLQDNGWLIIGSHEKLPDHNSSLLRHPSIPWAYVKKAGMRIRT